MQPFDILLLGVTALSHLYGFDCQMLIPAYFSEKTNSLSEIDIDCSLSYPYTDPIGYKTYNFISQTPVAGSSVARGYLCSKERWSSHCSENFLGFQTKTFEINRSPISHKECEEQIKKFEDGSYRSPFKPEYECSWMGDYTNFMDFVLINQHDVQFDHYGMVYKDNLFMNKECSSHSCSTRYDSVLWISHVKDHFKCPRILKDEITIHYNISSANLNDMYISSSYIPTTSMVGTCKGMHYCNTVLYLTKYGHGFILPERSPDAISKIMFELPLCSQREVALMDNSYRTTASDWTIEEEFRMDKCLNVVDKITKGLNISRRDLSYMSPLTPGLGNAFGINKNGIFKVRSTYIIVENITASCDSECKKCKIAYSTKTNRNIESEILHTHTLENSSFTGCDWLNGIIISGEEIILPKNRIMIREFSDIYLMEYSVSYDKHPILNDKDESEISGYSDREMDKKGNVWENFKEWGRKWVTNLIIGLVSTMVIVLIVCFCPFHKCLRCNKKNKNHQTASYSRDPFNNQSGEEVTLKWK